MWFNNLPTTHYAVFSKTNTIMTLFGVSYENTDRATIILLQLLNLLPLVLLHR